MSQQNLFDLNASKKRVERSGSAPKMPADIHTNVTVVGLELGDNYVDVFLEDSEGRQQKDRHWFPEKERLEKGMKNNGASQEEIEAAWTKEVKDRIDKLVQYMEVFMNDEELGAVTTQLAAVGGEEGFPILAKKAKDILTPRLHTEKINIRLIPDKKADYKYATFPRFASYVEKYVEGEPASSRIAYSDWEVKNLLNKVPKKGEASSDDVITNRPDSPGALF